MDITLWQTVWPVEDGSSSTKPFKQQTGCPPGCLGSHKRTQRNLLFRCGTDIRGAWSEEIETLLERVEFVLNDINPFIVARNCFLIFASPARTYRSRFFTFISSHHFFAWVIGAMPKNLAFLAWLELEPKICTRHAWASFYVPHSSCRWVTNVGIRKLFFVDYIIEIFVRAYCFHDIIWNVWFCFPVNDNVFHSSFNVMACLPSFNYIPVNICLNWLSRFSGRYSCDFSRVVVR